VTDLPGTLNLLRLNLRDHRKLLIVDGKVAFTGGINIADGYARGSFSKVRGKNGKLRNRDTQIGIEGPAAAEFQMAFLHVWNEKAAESGLRLLRHEKGRYFPLVEEKGHELVRAAPEQNDGSDQLPGGAVDVSTGHSPTSNYYKSRSNLHGFNHSICASLPATMFE